MTDMSLELRAVSDSLLRDLEALFALEEEKRALPPSDPRLTELAARIHEIAARVLGTTARQRRLTEVVAEAPGPDLPIEAVERPAASILAEWRDVERRLEASEPGSADRAELEILAERIRDEYRRAFDRTQRGESRG